MERRNSKIHDILHFKPIARLDRNRSFLQKQAKRLKHHKKQRRHTVPCTLLPSPYGVHKIEKVNDIKSDIENLHHLGKFGIG